MTLPVCIVLPSSSPVPSLLVGGLPLVNRHILELSRLGVRDFYLCGGGCMGKTIRGSRLPTEVRLQLLPQDLCHSSQGLRTFLHSLGDLLLVRGDCLIDPRLLAELLNRIEPHWLRVPGAFPRQLPAAARLTPALVESLWPGGLEQCLQDSPELRLDSMDNYSPSHRGPVPFYVLPVTTPEEAKAATRMLVRTAQKRALDLPALLLDPLFENPLVRWLCTTRITPNQVTVVTTLVGAGIVLLFLYGWLRLGILLTYAVEVLDGVDGKLARTKLQTSRFGEMEHVLDFFVEHAWYLSLTIFLVSSTGKPGVWWLGGGLMLCDLVDNLLYGLGKARLGKQLDELSPFDRTFRLIAGRRNIYCWMFLPGFMAGFPLQTLATAAVWALITVGVHAFRLVYHLCHSQRNTVSKIVSRS